VLQENLNLEFTSFILDETTVNAENGLKSMQICRVGTFSDPRYGKFSITKKHFQEMIDNFNQKIRGIIPALDYNHEAENVAAGWFKKLYLKNENELWADIEMTPKGSKVLSDKEFGYVSIEFDTNYVDNETNKKHGAVLLGAGLTNRPVVKRMQPVVALSEGKKQMEEELKKENESLKKELEILKAKIAEMELMEKEYKEKVKPEMGEMEKKLSEVTAKLSEAQIKIELSEKNASFDKLLHAGKAVEAQREAFIKNDMTGFIEKSEKVKFSEQGHSNVPASDENIDAEDKVLEEAKKLSESEKISLKEAISQVLRNNKKLAEKLDY
jgi:phage I-like protein